MKKHLIFISAALLLGLAACGQRAVEVTPTPTPTAPPRPTVMVTATAAPVETAQNTPPALPPEPTSAEATAVPTAMPGPTAVPKPVDTPAATPTATPEPTPQPTPEPTATPEITPVPEQPSRPTDEEVLEAYRDARTAYNWFDLETLEGHQDEKVELEGMLYARVADERFQTMDSFRGYLKTLFSDEVVDNLLPLGGQQYVEIDGRLYVSEGARGTDITKGAVILSVDWPQEGESVACTVRAEIELLDEETLSTVVGTEIHQFPYQKVGDKWVFTWFASIN